MMLGILIIIAAWVIEMPFWFSITATVCGSLRIAVQLLIWCCKAIKEFVSEEGKKTKE